MKRKKIWYSLQALMAVMLSYSGWCQTPCSGGMAGVYPCNNIDLISYLPLSSIGGGSIANDVWGWTDITTGKEYVLQGKNTGTAFIDISNPESPVYLGTLPTHSVNSSWRDIKVYKDHAFIVSEAGNHGIQIFDLTILRDVTSPPVSFTEKAFKSIGGNNNSHNIVMNETSGYAFTVGTNSFGSGGPVFFNINNPSSPVNAGSYASDGYTHDAQAITYLGPDSEHLGKEIIFASNEDTQTIIDASDKSSPVEISKTTYSGTGYTHQGWVTQDHRYLIFNDELDEKNLGVKTTTFVFDISDLDSPVFAGKFVNTTGSIDHNLYVKGNFIYQSNYSSGLRILRMDDPTTASFTEVGFFDVYPADDVSQFTGTWSNYPYFPSGNIAVSNMYGGVFIVKPNNLPHFVLSGPDRPVYIHQGETAVFDLSIENLYGFTDNVTFSQSGSPSGTVADFSNSALTLSNTADVPVGNYSIHINGISGGIKHDISVGLVVTPPCNLNVSSNAASGPNTLADVLGCSNPGETIMLTSSIANMTIDLGANTLSLDKDITIEADVSNNIFLSSSGAGPTFTLNPGVSATLKGFKMVTASGTYETLLNEGTLTLHDMILENTNGNAQLVNSPGSRLEISGTTTFKK